MDALSQDVVSLVLVLVRVLPLGLALSMLTRELIPHAVALSLTLALTFALAPVAGQASPFAHAGLLLLALLRELCIGGVFALALTLALSTIAWAVSMSQGHAGHALAPFTRIYTLAAAFLVLSLGGQRALVIGLAESFRDAALGLPVLPARTFAFGIAQLLVDAFTSALGFALPLLVSVWLLELATTLLLRVVAPSAPGQTAPLRPILFFTAAALLLVPVASSAPEAVRGSITSARTLTRALAR